MALRDLEPGDELTSDYGTFHFTPAFPCCCGSSRCRGTIVGGSALEAYRAEAEAALAAVGGGPQDLADLAWRHEPDCTFLDTAGARR